MLGLLSGHTQTFRVLRAQAHKSGHPHYREWEEYDKRKERFVTKHEGCCERVEGIVWTDFLPVNLRKRGKPELRSRLYAKAQPA